MPISRFIGCVAVTTSMKALTFDTRSAIAKECINRVRFMIEIMNKMRFTKVKYEDIEYVKKSGLWSCWPAGGPRPASRPSSSGKKKKKFSKF